MRYTGSRLQSGVVLIEALVSILIFSFGILAIIGLQASAIKMSSDAKYRSDASLFANQLIGQMMSGDKTAATLIAAFQSGGASFVAWRDAMAATNRLPGVAVNPPTVAVAVDGTVTVTIFWQAPGDSVHQHQVLTRIVSCSGSC